MVLVTDTIHPPISSIKDIQTRTLLVFCTGCSYRERLEQWFHQERVIPKKIMEFGTLDAIIGCVSSGLGISMVPQSVVAKQIQEELLDRIHFRIHLEKSKQYSFIEKISMYLRLY